MKKILLKSAAATKKFAARLAKKILKSKVVRHQSLIIGLIGDLGAGKTTFVQGFARALGVKGRIISPTFLIFRVYHIPASRIVHPTPNIQHLYHIDCYRIHNPKDLKVLGFKKILKDTKNIVLIEWADWIRKILPKDVIWLEFSHGRKENERFVAY